MSSRPLPFASVLLALLLFASPAFAWVEMHVSAYEARIELSRQGTAKIDNTLRFRVGGGPLRTFDVKIADRNVTLPEDATLAIARDGIAAAEPVPVRLEQRPDGDVRVDIDGAREWDAACTSFVSHTRSICCAASRSRSTARC